MEFVPQYAVASAIRQPESIFFAKALEAGPLLVIMVGKKVARGLQQQRPFALFHFFKAHVSMMAGQSGDSLAGIHPASTSFSRLISSGLPAKAERAA